MSKAYILINLGAPKEASAAQARVFLREFLSDRHVLNISAALRMPLAMFISRRRAAAYAKNIAKISPGGEHPLIKYTKSLARKISAMSGVPTYPAFRYGEQSIKEAVSTARLCGADEFRFVPMYPQCALSTTISAKREASKTLRPSEKFLFLHSYHDNPDYISALFDSAKPALENCGCAIASFHSIPLKDAAQTAYESQCLTTLSLLRKLAGETKLHLAWQSKMGRGKWLEPSVVDTARNLARNSRKKLAVLCPGFSCDCTETILEIGEDLRRIFLDEGGEIFQTVPCLNDSDIHAAMFCKLFESLK